MNGLSREQHQATTTHSSADLLSFDPTENTGNFEFEYNKIFTSYDIFLLWKLSEWVIKFISLFRQRTSGSILVEIKVCTLK